MKKCGFVIRVSTDRQVRNEEGSLKNQLQLLRAHVDYKNLAEGKTEWLEAGQYTLKGVSGKDSFRSPEFARLFEDIKIGKVNTIVCTALDRISRSVKDFLNFFEILTKYNVEFVCLKQNYDTTSSQGKLFITIMMALAEFEREQTSERTRESVFARAVRGLWNGSQLIGYDLNPQKKGHLLVNEKEKALVQFAYQTYLQCGSILTTVKRLNDHGYRTKEYMSRRNKFIPANKLAYTTVHHLLTNLAYIGKKEINKRWRRHEQEKLNEKRRYQLVPAVWEPLIDEQTFNQTQLLLKKNYCSKQNVARAIKHVYMLNAGKLWCGVCGGEMEGVSGTSHLKKKYYYYQCKNIECKFRVAACEIELFVINYIKALASDRDTLRDIIAATNGKLHKELPQLVSQRSCLKKELEDIKNFAQGILDKWTNMATDDTALFIKDKLNELGKRRKEIENGLSALETMIEEIERESVSQELVESMLGRFGEIFESIQPYQQKELISLILHRATLSPEEIKIALYGRQTDTRLFTLMEQPQNEISQNAKSDSSRPGISEWLPGLDAIRTAESSQEVVLLIQFYKHRQKGLLVSLGKPVIKTPPKRPKRPRLSLSVV